MRTLFDFELENDPRIKVDRRAKQRDKNVPTVTDIRWVESYGQALKDANQFGPSAIVKEDGSCLLFGCGGSGLVWVCGNAEISEVQQEMVDLIVAHLVWLGAEEQHQIPLPYYL